MKNRNSLSEKEIKAMLTRLKTDQAGYPADLLENRRVKFLVSVPAAGFLIADKAIYKAILHGIRTGASLATKVILLSVVSIAAVGTLLVGYKQGWIRFVRDDINTMETMTAGSHMVETLPLSQSDKTGAAGQLTETISPTQTPTSTPTGTLTPSATPTSTLTPTFTPLPTLTPTGAGGGSQGVETPNINPPATPTGGDDQGNHYGQTPTPPAKRTRNPPAP
jgi:hypothetical protein